MRLFRHRQTPVEREAERHLQAFWKRQDEQKERDQSVVICGECKAEIRPDTHANILDHLYRVHGYRPGA